MGLPLAAPPCNNNIDPALSITHTAIHVPILAVGAPIVLLYMKVTDSRF